MNNLVSRLNTEGLVAAEAAGLRYVSDTSPGIRRRRCGRGFIFLAPTGQSIRDSKTLQRIKGLVVPPAWQDVWICPVEYGHIQATGRDDRARKQYIYHPEWQRVRDEVKFSRMMDFSESLPKIRSRTEADLRLRGLGKAKVLATVVRLLDLTHVRVGNMEYAEQNSSFGLTTLRDRHVAIAGTKIRFEFPGKRGIEQRVDLQDRRLARIVRQCMEIPGYTLFQYYDEQDQPQPIDSGDVNDYLHEICGGGFTAKDFRTWGGTLLTMMALRELGEASSKAEANRNIVQAVKQAARHLGNQPSACRKYYIHPAILECYLEGNLISATAEHFRLLERAKARQLNDLQIEEEVMLNVLRDHN
jgi:DNA topoisomerase-1